MAEIAFAAFERTALRTRATRDETHHQKREWPMIGAAGLASTYETRGEMRRETEVRLWEDSLRGSGTSVFFCLIARARGDTDWIPFLRSGIVRKALEATSVNSTLLARTCPELLGDQVGRLPVLGTDDTLMATVPWGRWRAVLIYLRQHAGRRWLRLRTFNKHRTKEVWYPSPRFFVVPWESVMDLAEALEGAANGERMPEPEWYADFESQYQDRSACHRSRERFPD